MAADYFERVRIAPSNRGPLKQFAIKQATQLFMKAGVVDPSPESHTKARFLTAKQERDWFNIPRFSPNALRALTKKGYLFFWLTGQTLNTFKSAGYRIASQDWDLKKERPELLRQPSGLSRVAILPHKENFLADEPPEPDTHGRQRTSIEQFSRATAHDIPGVCAYVGSLADYTEILCQHTDRYNTYLFDNSAQGIQTSTRIEEPVVENYAVLLNHGRENTIRIASVPASDMQSRVIIPIVAPGNHW